jgi:hypothetical protein
MHIDMDTRTWKKESGLCIDMDIKINMVMNVNVNMKIDMNRNINKNMDIAMGQGQVVNLGTILSAVVISRY